MSRMVVVAAALLVAGTAGCGTDDSAGTQAGAGSGAAGEAGSSAGTGGGETGSGGAEAGSGGADQAGSGGGAEAGSGGAAGEAGGTAGADAGGGAAGTTPEAMQVVGSSKSRLLAPEVPAGDAEALRAGNAAFALDLYQVLRAEAERQGENIFFSPHSISIALGMTYAGARGNTEAQMADALHFTLEQEKLHPAFNQLDLALRSRAEPSGEDANGFRLSVVNSIWPQKDYPFLPDFLDVLGVHYGASLYLLDFISDPEGSRLVINDWVAGQTENRIQDLIPEGVISALTRLVLTNAVYFNAAWQTPFDEADTTEGAFTRLDGTEVTVPMMRQTADMDWASGSGWQAVALPYEREELGMALILPDDFEAFESSLDLAALDAILDALSLHSVDITLPKFSFDSSFSLKDALISLGMTDAFDDRSDFSGMDGSLDLYIEAVLHKAFVDVNEAGTEAAAATAVVVNWRGLPEPTAIVLDRPFLFLIWDGPTGAILFLGRVVDPS
jgi:serpin B